MDVLRPAASIPGRDPQKEQRRQALFQQAFSWLRDHLPEAPTSAWTVLEAGQGRLGWSDLYHQYFDRVYGIDIRDFSAYHPGVQSLKHDLTQPIPLPAKSIKLIVSHSVFEHLPQVERVLENLDRILKVGGFVFITVSPLYFSASGSHINVPRPLRNWEHLDPSSPYYLLENPLADRPSKGHYLNKMTYSQFLGWVGKRPWSIVQAKLGMDPRPIPDFVESNRWPEVDLRLKNFYFLAQKQFHCS